MHESPTDIERLMDHGYGQESEQFIKFTTLYTLVINVFILLCFHAK